jgi:hypothetical protein
VTRVEVREELIDALRIDLVGPSPEGLGDPAEWLDQPPSRWYLTGFLVPVGMGPASLHDDGGAFETAEPLHQSSGGEHRLPNSAGLTILLPENSLRLRVSVTWGDYRLEGSEGGSLQIWKRAPHSESLELEIGESAATGTETEVPRSDGLRVALIVKPLSAALSEQGYSPDAKKISIFLVNRRRTPEARYLRDTSFAFQVRLELQADVPFLACPDVRSLFQGDWDDEVAALQYRDNGEYAVGHNVSTEAFLDNGVCLVARTCWIPRAEVERFEPLLAVPNVELGMYALGSLADGADAWTRLSALPLTYRTQWISLQRDDLATILEPNRRNTAQILLNEAEAAAVRMDRGIDLLNDDAQALEAFRIANRAMADAASQRRASAEWYPFQLAFLLMNLEGIAKSGSSARGILDMLFFPGGGGKTEAYLGLAAFTLALRRLRHPGVTGAGVAVLMRYKPGSLPLDQMARAAALICALESIRNTEQGASLGDWPFEIGLWFGSPARLSLKDCPWCGTAFDSDALEPSPPWNQIGNVRVKCANRLCKFNGRDHYLPVVFSDESICRRLPCFLLATMDRFAALPWLGRMGGLFGAVDRFDGDGFYGPCDPDLGDPLPGGRLLPPELMIQDDADLLSGPMSTIAGLYETVVDQLSATGNERPKIVGSAGTARKSSAHIGALFGRLDVSIFPPPGPDWKHSFFAQAVPVDEMPGRLHASVAAPGRNRISVLLRIYLALLCRAHRFRDLSASDLYLTTLGYFDALPGLAGRLRLAGGEIRSRALGYVERKRLRDNDEPVNRQDLEGLTSDLARHLEWSATDPLQDAEPGLMVVIGQPLTAAEYIESTGRVGRDKDRPGLVVAVLDPGKPHDRHYFERFTALHESFYRGGNSPGATPFSARALDRDLAPAMAALARHGLKSMTPPEAADAIVTDRTNLEFVPETLRLRSEIHADGKVDSQAVKSKTEALLDTWETAAKEEQTANSGMKYYENEGDGQVFLLRGFLSPELMTPPLEHWKAEFRSKWNMADDEPVVRIRVEGPEGRRLDEDNP